MGHAGATRLSRPLFALLSMLTLAACGAGGDSGGDSIARTIIGGGSTGSAVDIDPSAFEVQPYCPPLEVDPVRYILFNYERGKQDDARALLYPASIEKWARECRRDAGQVRARIGISGRITPGPAWKGGEVLLPIRIDLVSTSSEAGSKPVSSKVITVPITLGEGAPAELWSFVDDSFVFPSGADLKLVASIDQEAGRRRR